MTNTANLDSIYSRALALTPDATALVDPQHNTITYAQFEQQVNACAQWLAAQGIVGGHRVAVWLINRPEWLVLLFAVARLGATVVAVNTRYRSHELQYILSRSQASWLIMQPGFRKLDFPAIVAGVDADALPDLRRVIVLEPDASTPTTILNKPVLHYGPDRNSPALPAPVADRADLPAILFTTSGTTKGPKLVIHTQRTLSGHAHNVGRSFGFGEPGDSLLAALPLCGVFGLNSVLGAMAAGETVVMLDVFNTEDTIDTLLRTHTTHLFATDEMLRRIAEHWPAGKKASLKQVGFAAFSPGAEDLAQTLADIGFPLRGVYGSSEVMALFSQQSAELPIAERTCGGGTPSSPQARIRVRNPETGELCPVGTAGEIEIASPTNFVGYLNNPEASAAALMEDGYFKTGDLGYLRDDGSFVYLSRMGDAMRLGGFLVNPTEIEYAITLLGGIRDAQVVAVEMEGRLRPLAFVLACADAPEPQSMIDALSNTLAPFKVPARIWVIDEFPTTASANGLKFQRVKLRDMALERLAAETIEERTK